MKRRLVLVRDKYTKCDSGKTLNWLMHPFLYITLVFSVAFLFFSDSESVRASILFQQTEMVGHAYVNAWGLIGLVAMICHTVAFWIRGKWGVQLMRAALFGGFYVWLWAAVIYIGHGYWFQFLVSCVPNLVFWVWYALEWSKRKRGEEVAFV